MQLTNDEILPLIAQPENSNVSFFSQSLKFLKKTTLYAAGAISGYMYWPTSFHAAKFGGKYLQYLAAIGGSFTNAFFNIESFFNLSELPNFKKIPFKYMIGTIISAFCILPLFLMNIEDEDGKYVNDLTIALQLFVASLNVLVNIVGTIELIDSAYYRWKDSALIEKNKLIDKIDIIIKNFSHLKSEEQTPNNFLALINKKFAVKTLKQQIIQTSLSVSLGVISIPLIMAYTLISYLDMKDFAEKKWHAKYLESITLGVFIAVGNTIPSIGFLIKGINSCAEKIVSLEKFTLLFWFFFLPALFSGFTTHEAMGKSLKRLDFSGDLAEALKWIANLGAALIYNLPQMSALANRLNKNENLIPQNLQDFKRTLEEHIQFMENIQYRNFIKHPSNVTKYTSNFFKVNSNNIQESQLTEVTVLNSSLLPQTR